MYTVILTTMSEGYYEQGEFVPDNDGVLMPLTTGIHMLMDLRDTDTCIMPYHGPNGQTTGYATIIAVITLDGVLPSDEVFEIIDYWKDIHDKLGVPVSILLARTTLLTVYKSIVAEGFAGVLSYLHTGGMNVSAPSDH